MKAFRTAGTTCRKGSFPSRIPKAKANFEKRYQTTPPLNQQIKQQNNQQANKSVSAFITRRADGT